MNCPTTGRPCEFGYCNSVFSICGDPSVDYRQELVEAYGEAIGGMILSTTHCSLLRAERLTEYISQSDGTEDDLVAASGALALEGIARSLGGSYNPN